MEATKVPAVDRWSIPAARIFGALFLSASIVWLSRFSFDDAFIHMRIARNLAFDGVPYFNVGERVMGGSSPVWLVLVATLFRVLGSPMPEAVIALECLVISALLWTTDVWLRRITGERSLLTTLLSFGIVAGLVLPSAGFLMESALAGLLGVLGLLAIARERVLLAGLALGLAFATRYELGILAGTAWLATPGVRPRVRFLLGFVPVVLVEVALLLFWYGTLIPNTVRAKSIVYPISVGQFLDTVPSLAGMGGVTLVLWIVGAVSCAVLAGLRPWSEVATAPARRSLLVAGAFSALLLVAYAVKRTSMFQWYWPNVTLPSALAAGATALLLWRTRGPADGSAQRLRVLGYAGVACVAFATMPTVARTGNMVLRAALEQPSRSATLLASLRIRTYFDVGSELYRRCPTGMLLTSEIGAMGWSFRGRLVDGLGLVSPETLKHHPMRVPEQRSTETIGAIPAQAVIELRPDFVVGMETFLEEFLRRYAAKDPGLADYRLLDSRPVLTDNGAPQSLWGANATVTFVRVDSCAKGQP